MSGWWCTVLFYRRKRDRSSRWVSEVNEEVVMKDNEEQKDVCDHTTIKRTELMRAPQQAFLSFISLSHKVIPSHPRLSLVIHPSIHLYISPPSTTIPYDITLLYTTLHYTTLLLFAFTTTPPQRTRNNTHNLSHDTLWGKLPSFFLLSPGSTFLGPQEPEILSHLLLPTPRT